MRLYLTPAPSLEIIRYLRSVNGNEGVSGKLVRKRSLNDAIHTTRALNELDETAQRLLDHAGTPIHAFVAERSKGTSTKRLITHVFGLPVPYGAFLDIGHNICICMPQFAFLGIAAQADFIDTVCIGMELCGTYSRWCLDLDTVENRTHDASNAGYSRRADAFNASYGGRADVSNAGYGGRVDTPIAGYGGHADARGLVEDRSHDALTVGRGCSFELPATMRTNRVQAFAERLSAFRGSAKAQAAIRWMLDGSASPMETAVYLLLCLPKRLGGYGLPKPVLNPKLIISNPDGVKERYPDLFWPGRNIDVEYNSDAEHSGEWNRYRDSKREIELAVANVTVLPLTRRQLIDATEFDAFAQGLRRMLGIHARGFDLAWSYRRDALRHRLLAGWR